MKLSTLFLGGLASLAAAQTPAPYTDAKSGITFSYFSHSSGYFFGIARSANSTTSTDFVATIGGKGTGWSGVSLGGDMKNKLLIVAWPNGDSIVSSFRKIAQYGPPPVTTGTFTQTPIANGTYKNSTHWTYTFLCGNCIQSDNTTFAATDKAPTLGYAVNSAAPAQPANAASAVSKHTAQGKVAYSLAQMQSNDFETWKQWAETSKVAREFEG